MLDFSIIIPAWNAEKNLSRCLTALEQQTIARDRYEIIIVDDGSTDHTAEIARLFSVTYHHQNNQGPATARNLGVTLAKGSLIFFTDSDCIPDSNWLQEMSIPFTRPEVAAVKGAYRTEQKQIMARFAQLEFEERFYMLEKRDTIDMIDTYSAGFRKAIFQSLNGFDSRFPAANNEDTELSYRMAEQGHIMVFNPLAVVCHLNHPDSIGRYLQLKFSRGYWRMIVYHMFPGKIIKDSYTPQSLKLQIISILCFGMSLLFLPFQPSLAAVACLGSTIVFLALTIPFILTTRQKDPKLAIFIPLLLALRAGAVGAGALWGIISIRLGRTVFSDDNHTKNHTCEMP